MSEIKIYSHSLQYTIVYLLTFKYKRPSNTKILREKENHVTDVQDGARGGPAVDQLGLCVQHPRAVASDTLQKQPEGADSYCQKQKYSNERIYIRGKILSSVCTVHSNLVDNSR